MLSKLKVVTPPQVIIGLKNFEDTNKFKQKYKFQSKFKNYKKHKKVSNFQIFKLPLWFKVSGEYIKSSRIKEYTRLNRWNSFGKSLINQIKIPGKVIKSNLHKLKIKQNNKIQSKFKSYKKRKRFSNFQVTTMV